MSELEDFSFLGQGHLVVKFSDIVTVLYNTAHILIVIKTTAAFMDDRVSEIYISIRVSQLMLMRGVWMWHPWPFQHIQVAFVGWQRCRANFTRRFYSFLVCSHSQIPPFVILIAFFLVLKHVADIVPIYWLVIAFFIRKDLKLLVKVIKLHTEVTGSFIVLWPKDLALLLDHIVYISQIIRVSSLHTKLTDGVHILVRREILLVGL